jgi:hypothetical protein
MGTWVTANGDMGDPHTEQNITRGVPASLRVPFHPQGKEILRR